MRHRSRYLLLGVCYLPAAVFAQYAIGIQGGPLFFQGAWEGHDALTDTRGWTTGIQVVEGSRGESGFRVGLDVGQRAYTLRARNEASIPEEFASTSTMLWLSFEMRWPLSRKHRVFFELGPVIGAEVHETREGSRLYEGYELGSGPYSTKVPASETESGFAVRDGRWRFGVTAELPVGARWYVTGGAHLCPGVGSWARDRGYATLDASIRAGILYALAGKRKYGRR